ncbi:exodeoxyribonuclease V subunit beta [Alishewanella sp. HL-SH06]|uniref:exodeoxyribonuclease V subunit beta n=1 Tax=Alishewanella sp. HL-SH06 TaxID=3461144 RepID=UPI004042B455
MSVTLSSPLQLPLAGSALIEASAGTGKTFTIAALYVRFILAHIPTLLAPARRALPLLPADILVVTFTKAATAELKDRIRQRLVEAAVLFRDTETPAGADPFLVALKAEFAVEHWPQCAYALQMASEAMDEASVKTIHSWCQNVLREHAFSSGSLFSQQLVTDLSQLKLEAVRDYWRNFCYPLNAQQLQAVHAVCQSPEDLLERINGLWEHAKPSLMPRDLAEMINAQQQQYQQQILAAQQDWQTRLPRYIDWVDLACNNKWLDKPRTYNSNKVRKDFSALNQWLATADEQVLQDFPDLKDALLKNYGSDFQSNYTGPALEEDFPAQLLALNSLFNQGPDLTLSLLSHAVSWCKARFQQQLARDALMGFDDIIEQTARAVTSVSGSQLTEVLRQQYPVALIDEFQDTDPAQYSIFNAVYQLANDRQDLAVFLIGDPKQAIYAFRGADIFTYLQARRDTAGRHYTLATNFRSSQALVSATNAIFMPAEQAAGEKAFLFNSEQGNQVPFVEVAAKGVKAQLLIDGKVPSQALTLWQCSASMLDSSMDDSKPLSIERYRQSQAEHFSDYIVQLLLQAAVGKTGFQLGDEPLVPLQSNDIAILVSTHKEGHLMQQALRQRGLASVYLSDRQSVFDTEVARDLLTVLHACAEPGDRRALLAALYTALLQLPLTELDRLQHDDQYWDQRVGQFYQFAATWQQQGVLAMIRQLLQQFAIAERLLADSARNSGIAGERYLTDLLHLAEVLQQAAAKLDGPMALIRFLHEHIYQRDSLQQAADEQIVRLESDAELIQIVTIHKSKGLEYPLVFLPFISSCRPIKADDKVFNFHDEHGQLQQVLQADELMLARADKERLGEDIRKLYVALTRAKHACWVSLAPVGSSNNRVWQKTAWAHLAGLANNALPDELLKQAQQVWQHPAIAITPLPQASSNVFYQVAPSSEPAAAAQARHMPADHRFDLWWVASYSALKYGALRQPDSPSEHNLLDEQDDARDELAYALAQDTASRAPNHDTAVSKQALALSLHDLPRGAGPGTFLHNLLQDAADEGFANVAYDAAVRAAILARRCRHGSWLARREQLDSWLMAYLQSRFTLADGTQLCLADLKHYKAEPEFWFAVNGISTLQLDQLVCQHVLPGYARPGLQANYLNGMLKGFIDLVFEHNGRYYVIDYKSNYLGPDNSAYTPSAMRDKILSSRYDLQYVLYTLALHKLLKVRLKEQYCYEQHMGGVAYLFLRGQTSNGCAAFTDLPPASLITALEHYLQQGSPQGDSAKTVSKESQDVE